MRTFDQELADALERQTRSQSDRKLAQLFHSNRRLYTVGRNDESIRLAKRFKVDGIVDDLCEPGESWNNLQAIKASDVQRDSLVINCATSISPVDVTKRLKSVGLDNVIELSDLVSEDGEILDFPWFVSQQRIEIGQHVGWWRDLHDLLADGTSRKVLLDVLRFRLTSDSRYMSNYRVQTREQYFEEFMNYNKEVFVDAGGYNGDTSEEFINRYPNYKKIYLYEPSTVNMSAAKRRLSGRRDISFRSVGLSSECGRLNFDEDMGSASAITNGSGSTISVVTLDDDLRDQNISFIKMDLEGWEINALRGAAGLIRANRPKLAIAVYHSARDFREIPQYLLSLNSDYKIYIRHYTQVWSETVMYFR